MQQIQHSIEREFPFDQAHFRFLSELAHEKTGIMLPPQKRDMVYGRLARRLRALKLETFSDYCDLLKSDQGATELPHLINAITTNLTSFFREAHHFEHLRDVVLKPLSSHQVGGRFRVWSAACSSGMEPYSIAMVMKSTIPDAFKRDMRVLATDIDSNMLSIGSAGCYTASDADSIPASYRAFAQQSSEPDSMQVSDEIRKLVSFRQLNLLESWPMKGPFQAIFCRNVVIYFDKATKQKLFNRLADMLVPGGWLYIGHSENMHGICNRFELCGRTIYRRLA